MDEPTKFRLLAAVTFVGAIAHVVAPRRVLESVEWWYTEALQATFEPTDETVRRVRWLAVPNLLAAVYYWRRAAAADST